MIVNASRGADLNWLAKNPEGETWFNSKISLFDFSAQSTTDEVMSKKMQKLLKNAVRLNSEFLDKWNSFKIITNLEFSEQWGLGSSSTLIYLLAQWANIHPLELYFKTENGSGYDVACAGADGPIEYWSNDEETSYRPADFNPKFKSNLYFVHLNEKVKSEDAIKEYFKKSKGKKTFVDKISSLTQEILKAKTLSSFESLINTHEDVVAKQLGKEKVKDLHFSDYHGSIKSLGAWGGDFVLATSTESDEKTKSYFSNKGFDTVFKYEDLVL